MDRKKILFFVLGIIVVVGAIGCLVSDFLRNRSGGCVILPETHCASAQDRYVSGQFIGISANLKKGVKLYAPFDGELRHSAKVAIQTKEMDVWIVENNPNGVLDVDSTAAVFFTDLARKLEEGKTVKVSKGQLLGRTSSVLATDSEVYNFLVDFKRYNPNLGYSLTDAALLRQFFPGK